MWQKHKHWSDYASHLRAPFVTNCPVFPVVLFFFFIHLHTMRTHAFTRARAHTHQARGERIIVLSEERCLVVLQYAPRPRARVSLSVTHAHGALHTISSNQLPKEWEVDFYQLLDLLSLFLSVSFPFSLSLSLSLSFSQEWYYKVTSPSLSVFFLLLFHLL